MNQMQNYHMYGNGGGHGHGALYQYLQHNNYMMYSHDQQQHGGRRYWNDVITSSIYIPFLNALIESKWQTEGL